MKLPLAATTAFALWGVLHIAGAAAILVTLFTQGAGPAFAGFGHDGSPLPGATGGVLGYFAYFLMLSGIAALGIALTLNRQNSALGLALNTALIAAVEAGLVIFLMIPGHMGLSDAWPGFALMALGVILGGIACNREPAHAQ